MGANNTDVRWHGGSHIALMIMKMYGTPVTLDQMTEINPKKLGSNHRKKYADYLVSLGYATVVDINPMRYQITQLGVSKVYELARPDK